MKKEDGRDVYILGDSNTIMTPVEITDENGMLDYRAIVFSNNNISYSKGETAIIDKNDLILGFRSEEAIDHLIEKLYALKEKEPENG